MTLKPFRSRGWTLALVFGIIATIATLQDKSRAGTTPQKPGTAPPTFAQINSGILQPSCVSCHSSGHSAGGVDLGTYVGVTNVVTAGNPGLSRLYQAVSSGTMPPGGKLSPAQIQQLSDWITAGAPNN